MLYSFFRFLSHFDLSKENDKEEYIFNKKTIFNIIR